MIRPRSYPCRSQFPDTWNLTRFAPGETREFCSHLHRTLGGEHPRTPHLKLQCAHPTRGSCWRRWSWWRGSLRVHCSSPAPRWSWSRQSEGHTWRNKAPEHSHCTIYRKFPLNAYIGFILKREQEAGGITLQFYFGILQEIRGKDK